MCSPTQVRQLWVRTLNPESFYHKFKTTKQVKNNLKPDTTVNYNQLKTEMNIQPREIQFQHMVNIPGTEWGYVQHTPTLQLWYCRSWPREYHVSVYLRPTGIDVHSTWFSFCPRTQTYQKRHHGLCYINNRQVRRIRRRPSLMPLLFEKFQNEVHLLIEQPILRLFPDAFFAPF